MIYSLENWHYVILAGGKRSGLCGNIFGHPIFKDGRNIVTSSIVGYDEKEDVFITKNGTRYQLGKINKEYASIYPDAKDRLIRHTAINHATMHAENVDLQSAVPTELVKIIKNLNLSDRQGLQTPDRLSTTVVTKKMTGENLMKSQPTFHLSRFLPEPSFPSETLEKGDNDLNTEERLRRSLSRFIIQERKRKILANHIKI